MASSAGWIDAFPQLARLPAEIAKILASQSQILSLPGGSRIFRPGQIPGSYLLLLEGSVRVQQAGENGREIVLYRVLPGQSCTLTTTCLLGHESYPAEAIAEAGVKAVAIPSQVFDDLIARSPEFRRFVFEAFGSRIAGLFRLVEEVAFSRIDIRLAHKLIELSRGGGTVAATQQQLASELGTAREVVSRILSEFQRRGWVTLGRGTIAVTGRAGLETLAGEHR
jgi:CRP/FNR family transcriptional regulator, anaerobic regulatory protein